MSQSTSDHAKPRHSNVLADAASVPLRSELCDTNGRAVAAGRISCAPDAALTQLLVEPKIDA